MSDASVTVAAIASAGVVVSAAIQGFWTWQAGKRADAARNDERDREDALRRAERENEARIRLEERAEREAEAERKRASDERNRRRKLATDFAASANLCAVFLETNANALPDQWEVLMRSLAGIQGEFDSEISELAEYVVDSLRKFAQISVMSRQEHHNVLFADDALSRFVSKAVAAS